MDIRFQRAVSADLDVLIGFMQQFYALDEYAFDEQVARQTMKTLVEEDTFGRVWLIVMDGEMVGYMALTFGYSLEFHGRDAIVDELFLVEGARKRGIGTMALTFLSEECRALGIHALHLEVEHSNEAGLALYGKLGFEAHTSRYLMTRWIEDNGV